MGGLNCKRKRFNVNSTRKEECHVRSEKHWIEDENRPSNGGKWTSLYTFYQIPDLKSRTMT